jgi:hypothetical protein
MQNTAPSPTPVPQDIEVIVVSPEEASFGVAEFWSGGRQIAFTLIDEGRLTLRIAHSRDDVVVGATALAEALTEANRLLSVY